ncbi:hypothetical protein EVAR_16252_1 [Eumeta japonica]|uniref:Uncharacterized protein n=1 Tax=Eumeta variegata TaxID=151549 RepID=A0A4C1U5P4_EUMVA|nr:hypothetical protein EVAR_16252_1 [Eumeta japonica]
MAVVYLENKSARPVRYHTLPEYRREIVASAGTFCLVSESSGDPLPFYEKNPSIRCAIPAQETGNALIFWVYEYLWTTVTV